MLSSSSSSSSTNINPQVKYDVFLSFRGEDTRNNFTSHLYAALCRKNIETFIDNELIKGDEITPSLLDAIERSMISVVVFSESYASSSWCLEELVKILECKNKYGQIVIPVFYHVDPANVRNQTGNFGDSFLKIEQRFQGSSDKLERWRIALREAANLAGFDSHVIRPEYVLIEEIVKDILKRLDDIFPSDKTDLVGIESRIREIESLLSVGSKDVCTIGIWGIGGIGKTTIASAIFSKVSTQFEGSYFIQSIREESEKVGGLAHLRRELLATLLDRGNLEIMIPNISLGFGRKRLNRKKVLIVLDDVTHFQQIESLIGSFDWFMPGSLIIITTRNKQVLKNYGVKIIYEMKKLVDDDALKLFSQYAFGQDHPNESYVELSKTVIEYVQGVPLALKILGCFLFGRTEEDWESAIQKLTRIPHMDIQKVLKISYDDLDDEEKNIFLDIACFFKGEDREIVIKFLDACGFSAKIGISVLVDKSLVMISNDKITMHDLLQEMGREIVRQESVKDAGKRSRLWHHKDIYHVLTKNTGTKEVEGIYLDMSKIKDVHLNSHTFKEMDKLRFIKFYNSSYGENKNKVHNFEGLESVLTELRYLHWWGFPLRSLPSNIQSHNLVALEMPRSNIKQLWDGVQDLGNLKRLNLSHSEQVTKMPDLSRAQNLESLTLEGCTSLTETHSSIRYLSKLVILNLKHCRSLQSLPIGIHLNSLKKLLLSGCSNLKSFPQISCNIEILFLDGTAIKELPPSIAYLTRLVSLSLENCSRLESVSSNICNLKSLQQLILSGCSRLERLPDELGNLESLMELLLEGSSITEVPSSIAYLYNLYRFSVKGCKGQPQMGLKLPIFSGLKVLTDLRLNDCGIAELPESLGQISSLLYLYLDKNNFERIPSSIIHLSNLYWLGLSYCERLQFIPELPSNLRILVAHDCPSLEALSGLSVLFTPSTWYLQVFNFFNCFQLDQDELEKIVEDAQLKFQLLATAWWNESFKDPYVTIASGCICYPGSEIPEWFRFQTWGSSITLKLPPGCFNDKFVGFELSCVVAFRGHCDWGEGIGVGYQCKLGTEDGLRFVSGGYLFTFCGSHLESDHVLLGYDFGEYSDGFAKYHDIKEATFEFYDEDLHRRRGCCVVTKCAIDILYANDLEKSFEAWPCPSFWPTPIDEEEEQYAESLKY